MNVFSLVLTSDISEGSIFLPVDSSMLIETFALWERDRKQHSHKTTTVIQKIP